MTILEDMAKKADVDKNTPHAPSAWCVEGKKFNVIKKQNPYEGILTIREGEMYLIDADGTIDVDYLIKERFVSPVDILDTKAVKNAIKEKTPIFGMNRTTIQFFHDVKAGRKTKFEKEMKGKRKKKGTGKK